MGDGGDREDGVPDKLPRHITDISYREQHYARSRGGTNIGFADGHAT